MAAEGVNLVDINKLLEESDGSSQKALELLVGRYNALARIADSLKAAHSAATESAARSAAENQQLWRSLKAMDRPLGSPRAMLKQQLPSRSHTADTVDSTSPIANRVLSPSQSDVHESNASLSSPTEAEHTNVAQLPAEGQRRFQMTATITPAEHSQLKVFVSGLDYQPTEKLKDSVLYLFDVISSNSVWRLAKSHGDLSILEAAAKNGLSRAEAKTLHSLPDKHHKDHSPHRNDIKKAAAAGFINHLLTAPLSDSMRDTLNIFLSTDLVPETFNPSGSLISGWITKRGRNFGVWQTRFYVLTPTALEYFEYRSGPKLGEIPLGNAAIGRQSSKSTESNDDAYLHAFLIRTLTADKELEADHILCAESDEKRDAWISALMALQSSRKAAAKTAATQALLLNRRPVSPPADEHTDGTIDHAKKVDSDADQFADRLNVPKNSDRPISPSRQTINNIATSPIQAMSDYKRPSAERAKKVKSSFWNFGAKSSLPGGPGSVAVAATNSYQSGSTGRSVFGIGLKDAVSIARAPIDVPLPAIVYRCVEFLEAKGAIREEGIYRLSGSSSVIKALRERFDAEGDIDLINSSEFYDTHAVSGLVKSYLREIQGHILTRELQPDFLQVLELKERRARSEMLGDMIRVLPAEEFNLLRYFVGHLRKISNCAESKMNLRNLGIVFSPTLAIPTPLFVMFMNEFDTLFHIDPVTKASAPLSVGDFDIGAGADPRHIAPLQEEQDSSKEDEDEDGVFLPLPPKSAMGGLGTASRGTGKKVQYGLPPTPRTAGWAPQQLGKSAGVPRTAGFKSPFPQASFGLPSTPRPDKMSFH